MRSLWLSFSSGVVVLGTAAAIQAQTESRTEALVSPAGVSVITTQRAAPQVLGLSNPAPSQPGTVWLYDNPPGVPWISQDVAIGNEGTFDWIAQNLNGERLSFLSATADNPASPIWEDDLLGAIELRVAAADGAPFAVVSSRTTNTGPHQLRLYSGFSVVPITASVPVSPTAGSLKVVMSRDGERIAAGFDDPTGVGVVAPYATQGGTALIPLPSLPSLGTTYRQHDLSGDGGTVLLASQNADYVYDLASGVLRFQDNSTVSHDAHSVDEDGDTWARGGFDIGAWRFNGSTYVRVLTAGTPGLGFGVTTACDLSADGQTFVAAAYDATDNDELRIYCFRIGASVGQLLWTYVSHGTGGKQDVPSQVAVSDDGRIIAVATWGDGANAHPEVLIFDRDVGNVPVGGLDAAGSAFSVDLSGDGNYLVAGFKNAHANDFGNGGVAVSYRIGGQGHWLSGTPSIGQPVALNFGGAFGDTVFVMAGLGRLATPLPVAGFTGAFALDPALLVVPPTPAALIVTSPVAAPFVMPPNPALVGITFYTQSLRLGSNGLDNTLKISITP